MLEADAIGTDPGGAKDHLPSTVAPGMQGPQHSVYEMPQSSSSPMPDHTSCLALTLDRFQEASSVI